MMRFLGWLFRWGAAPGGPTAPMLDIIGSFADTLSIVGSPGGPLSATGAYATSIDIVGESDL